jgi:hypothetical protein
VESILQRPVILLRSELDVDKEIIEASEYFTVYSGRAAIPAGSTVIGRYSVLPYYNELCTDLAYSGSQLINSYKQHNFIADISQWYPCLEELTPKTWFSVDEIPSSEQGPFVIKGRVNSRKHSWNKRMFAQTRADIGKVIASLMDDSYIVDQGIAIRKYEPFDIILRGCNDLPITYEFRCFVIRGVCFVTGFYWVSHLLEVYKALDGFVPWELPSEAVKCLLKTIELIGNQAEFYSVDIAQKGSTWRVVEINDGQMSGLPHITKRKFYHELSRMF